mmetsp:Transcript_28113/g.65305  ORF Transcript_28113/g.65305 Transcript_28113/m.65305 type:complete len:158 (-) Transcript_28113:224-697(-)
MEGASTTLTSLRYFLLPLNLIKVGGQPTSPIGGKVSIVALWSISMVFETLIPEGVVVVVARIWPEEQLQRKDSRGRTLTLEDISTHRHAGYGNIAAEFAAFDFKKSVVLVFMTIATVTYIQVSLMQELCPIPNKDGDGLLVFSACGAYVDPTGENIQ